MDHGYFYGSQAEMFSFFRIPNAMVKDSVFSGLSVEAKFLYGLLLDRIGLSRKYGWIDNENRVYIIYQIAEISEDMGISRKKAINCLKELEGFGLVEKKRQGLNRPNILYLKNFMMFVIGTSASSVVDTSEKSKDEDLEDAEEEISNEVMTQSRKSIIKPGISAKRDTFESIESDTSGDDKKGTSGGNDNTYQEVPKTAHINHTDESQPDYSHTESDPILSCDEMQMKDMSEEAVRELVEKNLSVDMLVKEEIEDKELIKEIVELIIETLLVSKRTIWLAGEERDMANVKDRLIKLRSAHIIYVVERLKSRQGEIGNIRQYLLAMLYNAPTTVNAYYKSKEGQKGTGNIGNKRKNKFKNYSESTWDFAGIASKEKDYNDRKGKEIELGDENEERFQTIMGRAADDRG